MNDAIEKLQTLPTRGTDAPVPPVPAPAHNAHIHLPPNFSAFDTVAQAVDLAAEQGLALLGASNYYDYTVYDQFAERTRARGIFPLFGIEVICLLADLQRDGVRINDPANPGKMYLCGKGITRFSPFTDAGAALVEKIRRHDSARMADMCDRLEAHFASKGLPLGLSEDSVRQMIARRHGSPPATIYLQERHLCQAAQQRFFERVVPTDRAERLARVYADAPKAVDDAVAVQNEIRSRLMKSGKPAYVAETFIEFDQAMALMAALGGIACYPVLADGVEPLCEFESTPRQLIDHLTGRGIDAVEFIPVRNSRAVLVEYVTALRDAGFVVTAGTEHNTLDLIPLAPACAGGAAIPADIQEIFWEGACVIAAHQVRTLAGDSGYRRGRIDEFAAGGRSAIAAYRGQGNRA